MLPRDERGRYDVWPLVAFGLAAAAGWTLLRLIVG